MEVDARPMAGSRMIQAVQQIRNAGHSEGTGRDQAGLFQHSLRRGRLGGHRMSSTVSRTAGRSRDGRHSHRHHGARHLVARNDRDGL